MPSASTRAPRSTTIRPELDDRWTLPPLTRAPLSTVMPWAKSKASLHEPLQPGSLGLAQPELLGRSQRTVTLAAITRDWLVLFHEHDGGLST